MPDLNFTRLYRKVEPILSSTWFLGVVVALLSAPRRSVLPAAWPDPSWQFALQYAAEHRLHFGTDVIFTFGPLGFLAVPMVAYTVPAILSALYAACVQLSLGITAVWSLRRSFPLILALPIAFVAASLMSHLFIATEAIVAVVFIWCIAALSEDSPPIPWALIPIGGGLVSAIEVLGKLNTGLLVLAMCVVTVFAMPSRRSRNVLVFGAVLVGSLVVLWFASGQALSNVGDYLSTGVDVINGYARGHTANLQGVNWDFLAGAAMAIAALVAAFIATRGAPIVRRAGILVLTLLLVFYLLKQAFVFRVLVFMPLFASGMLAPWLAFRWRGNQRLLAIGAIAVISILYFPLSHGRLAVGDVGNVLQPVANVQSAADQYRELLLPGPRDQARAEARARLQSEYALDPTSISLLDDRRATILPYEFSIAWAYGLNFEPLPVLGSYVLYTEGLDSRNAAALASASGPQRILRTHVLPWIIPSSRATRFLALQDRFAPWEGAAQSLAMLCHFEALHTTERYQVLGRTRDRCGQPRPIGSQEARYGEPVKVPATSGNRVVYARVEGLAPSGWELLRTALYRSVFRYVSFDDGMRYRIYPDIDDDLILTAPGTVDFPSPFALAVNPRTMTFSRDSGIGASGDKLTIDFFAIRVRPSSEVPGR